MGIKVEFFSFEIIIVNNNNLINAWAYAHKFYLLHAFFLISQIKLWSQWKQRKRHLKILNLIYLTCLHNVRSHRITDTAVTSSSFENVIYSLWLGFGAGIKASRFILKRALIIFLCSTLFLIRKNHKNVKVLKNRKLVLQSQCYLVTKSCLTFVIP